MDLCFIKEYFFRKHDYLCQVVHMLNDSVNKWLRYFLCRPDCQRKTCAFYRHFRSEFHLR